MPSEINTKSAAVVEDVQLHRAESMINEKLEITNEIKKEKHPDGINGDVYNYIATNARSFGSVLIAHSVEIVMFLYMISNNMRSLTSTTMIMEKVCLVHLKYPQDICHALKDNPAIKTEVEKLANNYQLGYTFLQMLPAAILALFIGSWSDKYSRKIPILIAQIGTIIDSVGASICAYYLESRVEYYYISALFTGLSGGFISCFMVLYAYACDITTPGKRTTKYAFLEVAFSLSMPLGQVIGGWLYEYAGYIPVFLTSTCGNIVAFLWVIFFLKETRGLDNKDTWMQKFVNFWSLDAAVSSFKATIKRRPNRGRIQLWLLILSMSLALFSMASLTGILFFYTHHMYDWGNATFSTISAVYQVIGIGLVAIIVPLCKKYKVGDPALGILGSLSLMLRNIVLGLAFKTGLFHLAMLLGLFTSFLMLAGRARMSKIVSKDDSGKVFSFLTTAETLLPVLAMTVVSQIYNASLSFFAGLIFVLMGAIIVIPLGIFIWMARLPIANYEEADEDPPQDDELVETEDPSQEKH